jgi:predicted DCC family thiol-disulfide oxidoreductase YuxK
MLVLSFVFFINSVLNKISVDSFVPMAALRKNYKHGKFSGNLKFQVKSMDTDNKIDLLYDSECPICQMEVDFLKKRDIENRIRFTDLSAPNYDPKLHGNVQFADGMRKIRAILPDKTVVTGVEVFRQTYKTIGLGWIFEITNLPIIGQAADMIYDIWAENRLRLTGRGDLADVLKEKSVELREKDVAECDDDGCAIDF